MPQPLPISAAVEIDAPPERVWDVVGDVTRMPEWSPELRRCGCSAPGRCGSDADARPQPARLGRLAHHVGGHPSRARAGGGLADPGERRFSVGTAVLGPVIGGAAGHDRELADGIRTTLGRIKRTVEAAG